MTQISLLNNHEPKILLKHNTAGWNKISSKTTPKIMQCGGIILIIIDVVNFHLHL